MVSTSAPSLVVSHLFQGLLQRPVTPSSSPLTTAPPVLVQQATGRLWHIIQTLHTPESGWPPEQPLTPTTLLPYVTDEAEELREALQSAVPSPTAAPAPPLATPQPELFATVSAGLLWAIAASAPEAMTLLAGTAALLSPEWAAEGVRLVPVLILDTDTIEYVLDLSTQTPFPIENALPEEELLQLTDCTMPPLSLAHWRTQIWDRAIALTPELQTWRVGHPVQLLAPGAPWTSAHARLRLEWIPLTEAASASPDNGRLRPQPEPPATAWAVPQAQIWQAPGAVTASDPTPLSLGLSGSLDTEIALGDPAAHQAAIAAAQIATLATQLSHAGQLPPQPETCQLIAAVCQAMAPSPPAPLTATATWLRSPLTLGTLCTHVQWAWVQASASLIPLIAGVAAERLRPGQDWHPGTLVLSSYLRLQGDGAAPLLLDLANPQGPFEPAPPVTSDIFHLPASLPIPRSLWAGAALQTFLQADLQARSPLLAWLMTGTPVLLSPLDTALLPDGVPAPQQLQFCLQLHFFPQG